MVKKQRRFILYAVSVIAIIITGSQLLMACVPNQPVHQTYSYSGPDGFGSITSQKHILMVWKAAPGSTTSAAHSDPVLLKAELIGPFQTIDALLHAVRQSKINGSFDGKPVVATAPTLTLDTWTNRTVTSTIPVASTIQPGCYDIFYTVTVQTGNGNSSTRADAPVKIHLSSNENCAGVIQSV